MSSELKKVPIGSIMESPVAIRGTHKEDAAYIALKESIKNKGILLPIVLRDLPPAEDGQPRYGLVDGLQRYTAAKELGLKEIPANVTDIAENEVIENQIVANLHRVETKPVEYTKGLLKYLAQNPTMTLTGLAAKLAKSPAWIDNRLKLVDLNDEIKPLVDGGMINLPNAYALASLPDDEQQDYLVAAQTESSADFGKKVTDRVKEIKEAARKGKAASPPAYEAHPRFRKLSDAHNESEMLQEGHRLIAANHITSVTEAFRMGVLWTIGMDPQTIASEKAKFEADQAQKNAAREKRDTEKKENAIKRAEATRIKAETELAELTSAGV
jgi:ParB/RepB/Spo0J family partition protein